MDKIILAIDTSADETSVAVTRGRSVLSSVVSSQISTHKKWGGIVPSIAKLAHAKRIDRVCELAIKKSRNIKIDCVAVTIGPGLSVALEVGINKAKELSQKLHVPIYGVNHMEGHMYSPFVQNSEGSPVRELKYPFLSLLISGGHTMIVNVISNGCYRILGETLDDAIGEALDKASKMLGLGYPGGEVIEKLAQEVDNADRYRFPRPMIATKSNLNMSFSGLKTHFYYLLKGDKKTDIDLNKDIKFLASSFQEATFDVIKSKINTAITMTKPKMLCVGGGVSANKHLRKILRQICVHEGIPIFFPSYKYLCADNAAMIGVATHMMIERGGIPSDINAIDRVPRLTL
jgi:N6-L-threonylcarbamoyladenine synthase